MIVSGNPNYGLAQAIAAQYTDAVFFSRSNGCDLSTNDGRYRLVQASLEHNVFINCSALYHFNQVILLKEVWEAWTTNQKSGHIINIGSTADTGLRGNAWLYQIEKKALRDLNRNLTWGAIGGSRVRSTYISPGYLNTPSVEVKHPDKRKIATEKIVELITWVLTQPTEVNINEISLDPIQR